MSGYELAEWRAQEAALVVLNRLEYNHTGADIQTRLNAFQEGGK